MTTSNGRSADSRRSGRSVSQWLLGLLIVLALAASILMVFTDSLTITGSLAVIAALWAAVIGAILVTKFRRQAESAEAKSRDLRLVYELQLEREIAARRQYELDVETTIRKEVSAEANEELAELKAQVLALRSSLELLIGEPLPDQRAALPNEKLRELASGLGPGGQGSGSQGAGSQGSGGRGPGGYAGQGFGSSFGGPAPSYGAAGFADDGAVAARDFAATAPVADDGRHTEPVDPNEMTEVIPVVTDDPISGRIATEVPLDEVPDATGSHEPHQGADTVSDAEIVETAAEPESRPEPTVAAEPSVARPFAGGFYGGSAGADDATPPQSQPQSQPQPVRPTPVFTDETPTDEWAREAVAAAAAEAQAGATQTDTRDQAETETEGDAETATADAESGAGRHEGAGPDATPASTSGRRRRRVDDDADSAHSNGLPVSELLNQLRQADSAGGGRRRRAD